MKLAVLVLLSLGVTLSGCASGPKNEEFKSGIADCAMMCKAHPEVQEYSQKEGGGFLLLFFGGEEKKCACHK